jgi:hypothetical protein
MFRLGSVPLALVLLTCSNVFMTIAWYAHLRELSARPWLHRRRHQLVDRLLRIHTAGAGEPHRLPRALPVAIETRTGGHHAQRLRPPRVFYMKESMKLDFLWAALCLLGAVYFVFRS